MTEIRHIGPHAEFRACVDLQRETWGADFTDVVPASVLQVSQKSGGLVGGAFERDRLLGFVYSLLALHEDELAHWSHMLAVRAEARGRGLGRRLKLFQRDELLARGIETVLWTYDPMVARNAHLNVNRLGARVIRYVSDMYGSDTGSPLHAGGETDRLVVRWDLDGLRSRRALEPGRGAEASPRRGEGATVARPRADDPEPEFPDLDRVFLEVPADLLDIAEDRPALRRWRATVRNAFTTYLRRGYGVRSLHRERDRGRCFYVLEREG